jgi:carbon dioxide concentrating mechanism protein CcmO
VSAALGLIEVRGWTPSMVVLDAMEKAASVRVLQVEINDLGGAMMKITGDVGDVQSAIAAGESVARAMQADCVTDVIPNPDERSRSAYESKPEYNPLMEQSVVHTPPAEKKGENRGMSQASFAVGLIETQGFTAVFEAIDTAIKTANVEVLAKEKLGGGYITVVIKGDVAAVHAAIEAGTAKVNGLGKLIASHVIASPSEGVLSLLPKL